MRYAPTFFSVVALLWCSAAVLRIPNLTWAVPAYVIAQCAFALIGFLGLQKSSEGSKAYIAFFLVTFCAVLVLAMTVTGRLLITYPFGIACFVIAGSVLYAAATAGVVYYQLLKLYGDVPMWSTVIVIQAAVLSMCGSATLLTLVEPMSPALHAVALSLSLFWMAMGAFFFAYVLGVERTLGLWSRLNLYLPSMIAVVAFSWLAFQLGTIQREAAPQAVTSDRMQTQVAQ
jgi:hypothetical protein